MTNEKVIKTIEQAAIERWTKFNLSSNQLSTLPPEIGQLSNLQELDLSSNQLSTLPPEIGQLSNLTELHLYNNSLAALPPEIGHLSTLEGLDLSSNALQTLPPEIGQLKNLRELDIHDNSLDVLCSEIGQLSNLQLLVLSSNHLSELPREISQLSNLIVLNLNSNQLSEIPSGIGQLSKLEELDLSSNQLNEIPREIGQLDDLTVLYLSSNQLNRIPPEIGQLDNLTHLYLHDNQIKELPRQMSQLSNLHQLVVTANPLPIPPEILEKTHNPATIITYYLEQQVALEHKLLNEAKMLLVGQGDVGKTCLANRLIYDTFQEEKSTEGIDILSWELPAPTPKQEKIRLNVWDFGGQEIYHATHQFFLTKRSVYLLVWNARKAKDYEHIYYWLHTIEAFGEDSPIILVMTKQNERDDDLNLKDLKEKFPQIVDLYKVDSANGRGIPVLKEVICETAWKLPHMRTHWLKTWFTVRQRLENDERNWIDYAEFQQICTEENLDERQTEILGEYLHDLGIIIGLTQTKEKFAR